MKTFKIIFSLALFITAFLLTVKNDMLYWGSVVVYFIIMIWYFKNKAFKIQYFKGFWLIFGCYTFFLARGLNNIQLIQDLKFNLLWLISLIFFYNIFKREKNIGEKLIKYLFVINASICFVYILLKLNLIPNIYIEGGVPNYKNYRTYGPVLFMSYLLPFVYLIFNLKKDKIFYINIIVGLIPILINGNGQNLIIFVLIYYFSLINSQNIIKSIKSQLGYIFLGTLFLIFIIKISDERFSDKIQKIANPLQSETIQIRILDLSMMLAKTTNSWNHILLGYGVGVNSSFQRFHREKHVLLDKSTFLEIDNGFYYVYHRSGVIGLTLFLLAHLILLKRIKNIKIVITFLVFFIVTNLLSIHYFTYLIAPIFISLLLVYPNNKL